MWKPADDFISPFQTLKMVASSVILPGLFLSLMWKHTKMPLNKIPVCQLVVEQTVWVLPAMKVVT